MTDICAHLEELEDPKRPPVVPSSKGCKECLDSGDEWVHLRLCMSCGHVGCCDDSPNHHATKHFHRTRHPTIRSFEPGEEWAYCYLDEMTIDGVISRPGEEPSQHLEPPAAGHHP